MPSWSTATCQTNGIDLHYTRTGGTKPPLVLLHGLMLNGRCWTSLARALAPDYDVIMPDARGHGLSSAPARGYGYEDHAADVAGLLSALQLPPAWLLGHSMGGLTAALLASRSPHRLRGLILADPTFLSPEVQREVYASDVAEQHRQLLARPLAEILADARRRHPHRAPETLALVARARRQTSQHAFEVLTPPNPDFRQLVRQLRVPTLLVCGDRGLVSAAVAAELQGLNPLVQVAQVPGAGHALHLDQPTRFAAVVTRFLRPAAPAS